MAAIAALSRIGAVPVLLQPGSDLTAALRTVDVDTVIADPDNVASAVPVAPNVLVLGVCPMYVLYAYYANSYTSLLRPLMQLLIFFFWLLSPNQPTHPSTLAPDRGS